MHSKEELIEILNEEYPNTTKEQKESLAKKLGYKNSESLRQIASKLGVSSRYRTLDLDGEIWLVHDEYPDYLVSNLGRVKGLKRNNIIKSRIHEGYYDCRINNSKGERKSPRIHRLVAELFVEKDNPDYDIVNHKDGCKTNNHYENLEWCTTKQNNRHALDNIVFDYTNNKPSNHLKDKEVIDICERLQKNQSLSDIMGVSDRYTRARVEKIRQRKTFTQISKKYKWE